MAVFSPARRALTRPFVRLPGLLILAAIVMAVAGLSALTLPGGVDRDDALSVTGATDSPGAGLAGGDLGLRNTRDVHERPLVAPSVRTANEALPESGPPYLVLPAGAGAPGVHAAGTGKEASSDLVAEVSEAARKVGEGAAAAPVAEAPAVPGVVARLGAVERWSTAGIHIETEGQFLDEYSLANIDAALSALPEGVLEDLGNRDFGPLHILVNADGRTLSGDQPYRGPANFFSTNEGTNELVLYPQQSVFTIVHELGHAYNLRNVGAGRYAMVLVDPEMRSFLKAAGWEVTSTDAEIRAAVDHMHVRYSYEGAFHWQRLSNDDPLEDFANSFATYFLDPMELKQISPERYTWMAATFGSR